MRTALPFRLPLALLLLAPACGDAGATFADARTGPDATVPDALVPDAEAPDAAPPDTMPDSCDVALPCPAASANRVSVCGRLADLVTGQLIVSATPTPLVCGTEGAPTDGPCALAIGFYDALDFAANPTGAVPLPVEELVIDGCGRFQADSIQRPQLGFLAVTTDDASGADDLHRLTGSALPVTSGQVIRGLHPLVVTRAADTAWSEQAGLGKATFIDRGVIFARFLHGAAPVAGVRMTSNSELRPTDTFYFGDTDATQRTTVAPGQTATGANGAALMVGSSLVEHSAIGGVPSGCEWPSQLAVSIPGALFDSPFVLQGVGGDCP